MHMVTYHFLDSFPNLIYIRKNVYCWKGCVPFDMGWNRNAKSSSKNLYAPAPCGVHGVCGGKTDIGSISELKF